MLKLRHILVIELVEIILIHLLLIAVWRRFIRHRLPKDWKLNLQLIGLW